MTRNSLNEIDADEVVKIITRMAENAVKSQKLELKKVAVSIADIYENGGKIYTFGAGHAQSFAMELASRAGGMSIFSSMHLQDIRSGIRDANWDLKDSEPERLPENGIKVIDHHKVSARDMVLIASQSGRNGAIIEMAIECKARNIRTVGFGSLNHTKAVTSRHTSGLKLVDVVDQFIDSGSVLGDAVLKLPGGLNICAASTVCFSLIAQVLNFEVVKELLSREIVPPILTSANVDIGDKANAVLKPDTPPKVT